MKPQTPADGILKMTDTSYRIECSCTDSDHSIVVVFDEDYKDEIAVEFYTKVSSSNLGSFYTRFKHIWSLLTKGYIVCDTSILLSKQSALNLSEVLKKEI